MTLLVKVWRASVLFVLGTSVAGCGLCSVANFGIWLSRPIDAEYAAFALILGAIAATFVLVIIGLKRAWHEDDLDRRGP